MSQDFRSTQETGHWMKWHYLVLAALFLASVWLAVKRPLAPYPSWLVLMLILTVFIAVAGHGIKGMWRGALIDDFNRLSLSRLQMLAWTVVVVSALGVLGVRRTLVDPSSGLEIAVPPEIWLLMGISTTSLLASPAIKQQRSEGEKPANADTRVRSQGAPADRIEVKGLMVVNLSSRYAKWSNLFTGETVGNVGFLDIAKVQMFFFTVLTVITYCLAIGLSLRTDPLPPKLPDLGPGMLTLLAISHSGYLAGKLTAGQGAIQGPAPGGTSGTQANPPKKPAAAKKPEGGGDA